MFLQRGICTRCSSSALSCAAVAADYAQSIALCSSLLYPGSASASDVLLAALDEPVFDRTEYLTRKLAYGEDGEAREAAKSSDTELTKGTAWLAPVQDAFAKPSI